MVKFGVTKEKEERLALRFERLGILEDDIDEKFVRASGRGGQRVNKVSTCVQLRHLPTGIIVRCQKERSQVLNRFMARRRLADKIEQRQKGFVAEQRARREKIRRQKRRRSRRAREKMLRDKRMVSEKKRLRRKVEL